MAHLSGILNTLLNLYVQGQDEHFLDLFSIPLNGHERPLKGPRHIFMSAFY